MAESLKQTVSKQSFPPHRYWVQRGRQDQYHNAGTSVTCQSWNCSYSMPLPPPKLCLSFAPCLVIETLGLYWEASFVKNNGENQFSSREHILIDVRCVTGAETEVQARRPPRKGECGVGRRIVEVGQERGEMRAIGNAE